MGRGGGPGVTGKSSWPWMAASLAVILLAMFLLRDPVPPPPEEPVPAPRIATLAPPAAPQSAPATSSPAASPPSTDADTPAADEAEPEREPEGNPFAAFLAPPEPLTAGQDEHPPMESLEASDPRYSATVEAQQLFSPFEQALLAAEPLSPGVYKALLTDFKQHNMKVLKRADWLRKAGEPDAATELMSEWGRLFDHYKAQAYGRGQVPVPEEE